MPEGKIVIIGGNNIDGPQYGINYGSPGNISLPVSATEVLVRNLKVGDPVSFITDRDTGFAEITIPAHGEKMNL